MIVVTEDLIKTLLERAYMTGYEDHKMDEYPMATMEAEQIFLETFKGQTHDFS